MSCISSARFCSKGVSSALMKNTITSFRGTVPKNAFKLLPLNGRIGSINPLENITISSVHTSPPCRGIEGLQEFFDDKENWGAQEVKVGRSWKTEELRLKSNEDLHKLWFVLLKEKNMLLTMEEECKREYMLFPNPERIDKVEESMKNLENVVRERNKAFWLLETGETGERPSGDVVDSFGRKLNRRFLEHKVPDYMHSRVMKSPTAINPVPTEFSRQLREKEESKKRHWKRAITAYINKLFNLYPDIDMVELQKKYPDFDIPKIKKMKESRGNHDNN